MRTFLILLALLLPAAALEYDEDGMLVKPDGSCVCYSGGPTRIEWACRKARDFTASRECPNAGRRVLNCPNDKAEQCSFTITTCANPPLRNVCWPPDRPPQR